MAVATMTSKGQVTVPKALRDRLGLQPGTQLDLEVDEKGRLVGEVRERSELPSWVGMLSHLAKDRPVTLEEMNAAIRERAVKKWERAQRR